jgi:hypothetical protein
VMTTCRGSIHSLTFILPTNGFRHCQAFTSAPQHAFINLF